MQMNYLALSLFFFGIYREIVREDEIPQNMRAQTEDCYQELIEHVSNVDEHLGEIFLEERKPTSAELKGKKRIKKLNQGYLEIQAGLSSICNAGLRSMCCMSYPCSGYQACNSQT
jgi:elongation factor G